MTLLQFAAYKDNSNIVNYLLEEKGADPDIQGEYWYALRPMMTPTLAQGGIMERRSRLLRQLGTWKLFASSLQRRQMLIC
jgi:hypothetical protein